MTSYPSGVPTPYTMHVHPYPTRFHGGIWRRPAFGFPWVRQPFNVTRPSQSAYPPPPVTPPLMTPGGPVGAWDTGDGVFRRPRVDGGGIFNEVSGLGRALGMSATTMTFVGAGLVAFGLVAFLMAKPKKMSPNKRRGRHRNPSGPDIAGARNYLDGYYDGAGNVPPPSKWSSGTKTTLAMLYGVVDEQDYAAVFESVQRYAKKHPGVAHEAKARRRARRTKTRRRKGRR